MEMIQWARLSKGTINRIGYNIDVKSLYIDFMGSDVDTVYLDVPESLYPLFIEAKDPDKFFQQFVNGYFKEAKLSLENQVNSIYPYAI